MRTRGTPIDGNSHLQLGTQLVKFKSWSGACTRKLPRTPELRREVSTAILKMWVKFWELWRWLRNRSKDSNYLKLLVKLVVSPESHIILMIFCEVLLYIYIQLYTQYCIYIYIHTVLYIICISLLLLKTDLAPEPPGATGREVKLELFAGGIASIAGAGGAWASRSSGSVISQQLGTISSLGWLMVINGDWQWLVLIYGD